MFRSESIINSNGIGYIVIYDNQNKPMTLDPYEARHLVGLLQDEIKVVERMEKYCSEDIVKMIKNIDFEGEQK